MPVIGVIVILMQIVCAVHAYRNGSARYWVWIILMFPAVGCAAYLVAEMLPTRRIERHAVVLSNKLIRAVDPGREMRIRIDEATNCGSVNNKIALADECVRSGFYDDAVKLYSSCLETIYRDDPMLMYGLALAFFAKGEYGYARQWLDRLLAKEPNHKAGEARLYLARALEELGDIDAAKGEYEILKSSYAGEEARCRYALLLAKSGHALEAQQLFEQILLNARRAPGYYRREQREWIELARGNVQSASTAG